MALASAAEDTPPTQATITEDVVRQWYFDSPPTVTIHIVDVYANPAHQPTTAKFMDLLHCLLPRFESLEVALHVVYTAPNTPSTGSHAYGLGLFAVLASFAHAVSVICRAQPGAVFDAFDTIVNGAFLATPCELRLDRVPPDLWHIVYGMGMFSHNLHYLKVVGSSWQCPGSILSPLTLAGLSDLRITVVGHASDDDAPSKLASILSATKALLLLSIAYIGPGLHQAFVPSAAIGPTTVVDLANVSLTACNPEDTNRPASVLWNGSRDIVHCVTLAPKAIYNHTTTGMHPLPPVAVAVGYASRVLSRMSNLGSGCPLLLYERIGVDDTPTDMKKAIYTKQPRLCFRLWHNTVTQVLLVSVFRCRLQLLTPAERLTLVDAALELALMKVDGECLAGALSNEQMFSARVDLAVYDDEQFGAKSSVQGTVDALVKVWRECNKIAWAD